MFKGLKSLLAGLVTGTALGVLFAPKKGKETRKNIKGDFKDGGTGYSTIKDTMTTMGKEIGDTAKHYYDEISDNEDVQKGVAKAKEYGGKAKNKAGKLYKEHVPASKRKQIKKSIKKAKKSVKSGIKDAKKAIDKTSKKFKKKK